MVAAIPQIKPGKAKNANKTLGDSRGGKQSSGLLKKISLGQSPSASRKKSSEKKPLIKKIRSFIVRRKKILLISAGTLGTLVILAIILLVLPFLSVYNKSRELISSGRRLADTTKAQNLPAMKSELTNTKNVFG